MALMTWASVNEDMALHEDVALGDGKAFRADTALSEN